MDKTFLVYVAAGAGFLYFINNFMQDINEEDPAFQTSSGMMQTEEYERYVKTDSVGEDVLDVRNIAPSKQIEIWNHVSLRKELADLFPDFETMRLFVKNSIEGEPLRSKLLKHIEQVEDDFLSGRTNAQDAKRALMKL